MSADLLLRPVFYRIVRASSATALTATELRGTFPTYRALACTGTPPTSWPLQEQG